MIDLGIVTPGETIRIPFSSFDKDDGSSITMTNFAVGDILIYKDGSTTERASTNGYTATTDFDSKTGKHVAIIDLSDNSTAGFFAAGSEYLVAIDAVTVDSVTTGGWIARFKIGYERAIHNTSIATLSSQTSFTLTTGPAEDDVFNGCWAIIHDVASAVQKAIVYISDYTGSSKTVTLAAGATFTVAASDNISIMEPAPVRPHVESLTYPVKLTASNNIQADVFALKSSLAAAIALGYAYGATPYGSVQADGGNTASTFKIDSTLGAKAADYFGDSSGGALLLFCSGAANEYQARRVTGFNTSTDFITVESAFGSAPSTNDIFILIGRIEV